MKFIKKGLSVIKGIVVHCVSLWACMTTSMNEKQVCFLSDVRVELGGNLKSVYDYLEGSEYQRVVELRGDRRDKRSFRETVRLVYVLAKSQYILLEDLVGITAHIHVRNGQEIVQLWHGPGAYKRFGFSRLKNGEKIRIHQGYKKYAKASVSGEGIKWCYAEAFSIDESKVKATGFPRTDDFFSKEYKQQVKEKFYQEYPQLKDKKIILFAPTYRGMKINEASYDFSKLDYQKIYDQFHEDYVFITKWHPALYNNIVRHIVETPDLSKYGDFYQDFSQYRDINDLLIVCDLLVTDYSSMIFDYLLLEKPIVYFAYDLEEYTGYGSRGLYFDFDEYVYGTVARNNDELMDAMLSHDLMDEKRKVFYNKFMSACDGHSTEKTCQWIFHDILPQE